MTNSIFAQMTDIKLTSFRILWRLHILGVIQRTLTDILLGHVEVMRVVEFVWKMRIVLVGWRVDGLWRLVVGIRSVVVDVGLMGWRIKRRWGLGFVGGRREVAWDWD